MAHVAISRDFIQRVKDKIRRMENAELATLGKEPDVTLPIDSVIMVETIWGKHLSLRNQIPEEWKNKNNCARVHINTSTKVINESQEEVPVGRSFTVKPLVGEFDFPPNSNWHTVRVLHEGYHDHPDIKPVVDYYNSHAEIHTRWDSVEDKVLKFFNSCKSMKEAVTLWPECKVYIDDEDIKRFEKKVVKSASQDSDAAKVLAGLDTSELMGAAVVARLSGAA